MKNSVLLGFVCLLLGSVAGYGVRGVVDQKQVSAQLAAGTASRRAYSQSAVVEGAVSSTGGASASAGSAVATAAADKPLITVSLSDRMKELLMDYDPKSTQKALAKLSVTDLQAALALVAAMPKSTDRDGLRYELYRAWAAQNPTAAWQAALNDPLDKDRGYVLGAVAGVVAKSDPKAAIDLAMSLGMGAKRGTVMNAVFESWSKTDVASALAYANLHPDLAIDSYTFTRGLSALAETAPQRAAELALSMKDQSRSYVLSSLMSNWVTTDPSAAMAWANAQTNPSFQKDAISAVLSAWSKNDPVAALNYARDITNPDIRDSSLQNAWRDWFRRSPTEATGYLVKSGDAKLMENVAYSFSYLADKFTAKEQASLLAQIPEGKGKQDILRSLTSSQIRNGRFNQALEFLNAMPDSSSRDSNVAQLGQEWAKSDIKAAEAWLKIQPESTDRDLAVTGFATTLAGSNPQAALEWVNTIPDAALRKSALKNVATRWLKSDPAKADAWMAGVKEFTASDRRDIESMSKFRSDFSLPISVSVGTRR